VRVARARKHYPPLARIDDKPQTVARVIQADARGCLFEADCPHCGTAHYYTHPAALAVGEWVTRLADCSDRVRHIYHTFAARIVAA